MTQALTSQYDGETFFLMRALANAHLLIDEETNIVECLFCGTEALDSLEGFKHPSDCPVIRAQKWLETHASVESTIRIVEDKS